jgi:hypothetical protein
MSRHKKTPDPERLARIEAHAARVQSAPAYKAEIKRLRRRVPPKRDWEQVRAANIFRWLLKIDRLNAMGSNWGWSA